MTLIYRWECDGCGSQHDIHDYRNTPRLPRGWIEAGHRDLCPACVEEGVKTGELEVKVVDREYR